MSRIGVVVAAALVCAACGGAEPSAEPYEAKIECGYQITTRGQSYGFFGNPAPLKYNCRELPAEETPELSGPLPDLRPAPEAEGAVIEVKEPELR